ncbi:MAG TPA: hypothetical protein VMU67_09055 [Steroidobacteraceae bacterium]|nr:hypothetical protein [Steroidobacteraceae bacterium]
MPTRILMLIATVGLVACVTVKPAATTPATAVPAAAAGASQRAVWIQRKAHVVAYWVPCDVMHDLVKWSLLRLGARASDLDVQEPADECNHGPHHDVGIEATFSVLAPIDNTVLAQLQERFGRKNAVAAVVEARWQTVELVPRGYFLSGGISGGGSHITGSGLGNALDNCFLPKLVQQEIVPLFFARNAKLTNDCNLRVQELTAAPVPDAQYLLHLEREGH